MTETAFGNAPAPSRASNMAMPQSTAVSFQATLKNHQICFVVPAGATIDAVTVDLPGGILILGALRGKVRCSTGSAIIARGGEFQGILEANDVLVEGKITSPVDANGKPTTEVRARGQVDEAGNAVGGIIALSAHSIVNARFFAIAYQIPRHADLGRSILNTIVA